MPSQTAQITPSSAGADFLCKAFADALSASVSALLGKNVDVFPDVSGGFEEPALWFQAEFPSIPYSALAFGGRRESWLKLAKHLLAATGVDDPGADPDLILSTLNNISAEVLRSIASALALRLGHGLPAKTVAPANDLAVSAQSYHSNRFRLCADELQEVEVTFLISPELLDLLKPEVNTTNLELLMDVEMPVSISFGRAQLALKDVVKLTTGSIVELNRSVAEPVDIIVNNCTVARGEVVVVEGNFGVRIREVLSKEDRLKRLA